MSTTKPERISPWDLDLRVRERNLLSGKLDPKAVARHLAELPDVEAACESVAEPQPALGGRLIDEDDDDLDDDID